MRKYAGCGARKTPKEILEVMDTIGTHLANAGWMLRTGAAYGADSYFEGACMEAGGARETYLPWEGYNDRSVLERHTMIGTNSMTIEHAMKHHPNPIALKGAVYKLHARNSAILLGLDLTEPVDMVICWTPNAEVVGGTGQALRVAQAHNIPVFNLAADADWEQLEQFVEEFE